MISFPPLLPLLQTRGASVPPVTESERFQKERGLSAGAPGPIRLLALRPLQGVWPSPRRVLAPSRPPTLTPLAWAICGDSPRRLGSARRRVAAARRTAGPPRKSPVRIIPIFQPKAGVVHSAPLFHRPLASLWLHTHLHLRSAAALCPFAYFCPPSSCRNGCSS